ncbi:hypothetical protein HYV82_03740 [Candidatus Woesearchaeota archaeon]|nr:hypothetical protein [Candidatus Woesearchaeota archaeon]
MLYTPGLIRGISVPDEALRAVEFLDERYRKTAAAAQRIRYAAGTGKARASARTLECITERVGREIVRHKDGWAQAAKVISTGPYWSHNLEEGPIMPLLVNSHLLVYRYVRNNPPAHNSPQDKEWEGYIYDAVEALAPKLDNVVAYVADANSERAGYNLASVLGERVEELISGNRLNDQKCLVVSGLLSGKNLGDIGKGIGGRTRERARQALASAARVICEPSGNVYAYCADAAYDIIVSGAVGSGEVFVDENLLARHYNRLQGLAQRQVRAMA